MSEWKPIESVPKDRPVLLWEKGWNCATVGIWTDRYTKNFHALVHGEDALWNDLETEPIFDAKYWMELPDPPRLEP